MIKFPENKTRKRLRISQCILYLAALIMCSMPYIRGYGSDGTFYEYTVFDMLGYLGGDIPHTDAGSALQSYVLYMFAFLIIPIIGFFFCAFDKQRNLKNVVSMLCCLLGVIAILTIIGAGIDIGSMLSLLIYLVICFITTMAMFARITDKTKKEETK